MSTYLHTDHLLTSADVRIAHRGGSRNWAEHSAQAYRNSYARGYRAFEVAVAASAKEDANGELGGGELFLMHDWTLDRTSGVTDMVSQATPWSVISQMQILPAATAQPDATPQPYLTLDDYLDEFGEDVISLIDFKDLKDPDCQRVLDKIEARGLMDRCMGKMVYGQPARYGDLERQAQMWRDRGAPTWGAFYDEHVSDFPVLCARHELLGMDNSSNFWPQLLNAADGKPIIGHVIQGMAAVTRSYTKGAIGVMVANPAEIPAYPPGPYNPGEPPLDYGPWTQPWRNVYIGNKLAKAVRIGPNVVWEPYGKVDPPTDPPVDPTPDPEPDPDPPVEPEPEPEPGPFDRPPDFEDTFSTSTVNTGKWDVWDSTYLGYDWGDIKAANVDIVNGNLRQRVTRKITPVSRGGRIRHWNTAYMVSSYRQSYGRWEMRAKIPTVANQSQGLWPAFWLRNGSANGEIDIMESWGGPTKNRWRASNLESTSAFAFHENTNGTGTSYNHPIEWRADPNRSSYNTSGGFHVWTCDYMPDYLRIYFDGKLVADCRPDGDKHPLASQDHANRDLSWLWGPTFTGAPWEIRLNFQMGDNYWSSDASPATGALSGKVPAEFLVDYVRAWEYKP